MPAQPPSLPARLWLALVCFFRVIADADFALLVGEARALGALPAPAPAPASLPAPAPAPAAKAAPVSPAPPAAPAPRAAPAPAPAPPGPTAQEGALHLLALLQREGRLLDFCEEELAGFPDATVGAAARLVHAGCRKVLKGHFDLQPVRAEKEGAQVAVEPGFDARAVRLTGNVVGSPPFSGALRHHGWRAASVKLPEPPRGEASALLAPAEVELP